MEQYLRIGVITQSHGIKGEVKVFPTTDSAQRFREVKQVILRSETEEIETEIIGVKFFKNLAIVHFACFHAPEETLKFRKADVMIRREDAQPLAEGEYYIADLIGCSVYADEESAEQIRTEGKGLSVDADGCIGTLKDVLQTGANDVYIVKSGTRELLIPVIKECILKVDIEESKIFIHLLPGLL